ncbi:MAG: cell division protein FtsQ/DivIB, partial [Eubacteriales bacterium]
SEYGKTEPASRVKNYAYSNGQSFSQRQRERARAYSEAHPYAGKRRADTSRRADSRSYTYRPDSPSSQRGGEKVRQSESDRPLKLIIERIINLFDSIEERGRTDEQIAKQRAIARKRFYDHKNTIITALVVVIVLAVFVVTAYKLVFVIDTFSASGSGIYDESEILASSGISLGDNLYSFDKETVSADITFRCPYIKSAEITRTLPRSVSIALEDDSELYFADIWGEYVILSPSLRVLGTIDRGQAREKGLIELVLPAVSYSVSGRAVEFVSARDERFIRNILTEVMSSELFAGGIIDKIDLSDEYAITMQAQSKYILKFGSETDCDLKLRMAYRTIDKLAEENTSPAKIDLTTVGEASVRFDMQLELD